MTSRIVSAGSRLARRPLSSLLLFVPLALVAACATALPREPLGDDARRALTMLAERYAEFTDMRALADVALRKCGDRQLIVGVLVVSVSRCVRRHPVDTFDPD